MSHICWSDIALVTPHSEKVNFIDYIRNVLPAECDSQCREMATCDAWTWRRIPDGTQVCGFLGSLDEGFLSLNDYQLPDDGSLAFSQWKVDCGVDAENTILDAYYVKNIDPELLNSPMFKPGETTLEPLDGQIVIDQLLLNLDSTSDVEKQDYDIMHGVIIKSDDISVIKEMNNTPLECEWLCAFNNHDYPCVGYQWTAHDSSNIRGTCELYDTCPAVGTMYRTYELKDDMDLDSHGLPIPGKKLDKHLMNLGPASGIFSWFDTVDTVVTGLDLSYCSFPDTIENAPLNWQQWLVIGIAGIVVLLLVVFSILACCKQCCKCCNKRSKTYPIDTLIYEDLSCDSTTYLQTKSPVSRV